MNKKHRKSMKASLALTLVMTLLITITLPLIIAADNEPEFVCTGHEFINDTGVILSRNCEYGAHEAACSVFGCDAIGTRIDFALGLGHEFINDTGVILLQNCENGIKEAACSRFGCDAIGTRIDFALGLGHEFINDTGVIISRNCEYGTHEAACSRFGCDAIGTRIDFALALGHDYNQWKATEIHERTCTQEGIWLWPCDREGCTETHEHRLPGTHFMNDRNYDWSVWKYFDIPATCEEDGFTGWICKDCGEEDGVPTPALVHNFNQWQAIQTQERTCTQEGIWLWPCDSEGCTETHEYRLPGTHFMNDIGYDWSVWKYFDIPATCEEDGFTGWICKDCGEEDGVTALALDHNFNQWQEIPIQKRTCTQEGIWLWPCDREGCTEMHEYRFPGTHFMNDIGYDWSVWKYSDSPATCVNDGFTGWICKDCGEKDGIKNPARGHEAGTRIDTADGWEIRCKDCNVVLDSGSSGNSLFKPINNFLNRNQGGGSRDSDPITRATQPVPQGGSRVTSRATTVTLATAVIDDEEVPLEKEPEMFDDSDADENQDADEKIILSDAIVPLAAGGSGGMGGTGNGNGSGSTGIGSGSQGGWSLLNFILCMMGFATVTVMGIRMVMMKDRADKRRRLPLICAVPLLALAGIVTYVSTQNMGLQMVLADNMTISHALLFVGGLVSLVFSYRREEEINTDELAKERT